MKKFLYILFAITIILSLCACGNNNAESTQTNPSIDNNPDSNIEDVVSTRSGEILFSTPYMVEDYVENAIIVSKNDQLLYGVLDNNGNEIIPIKYDEIDFINKENYINGIDDELYFLVRYEGVSSVLNIKAEEIFSTSRVIWSPAIITTDMRFKTTTDDSPYFIERLDYSYALYNEKGDFLYEVAAPFSLNASHHIWLSNSIFCYYGANISTYNNKEEQIDSLSGSVDKYFFTTNKIIAFVYDSRVITQPLGYRLEGMKLISIDTNGFITIEKEFNTIDEYNEALKTAEYQYGNKKYNLYTSNGTWKLEDPNGIALYDERYYNAFTLGSKNRCYALINEDNQIMIIDRNGKKIVDYGVVETTDNSSLKMLCFDSVKQVAGIFEGAESIIIPVASSAGYFDIYYYTSE